MSEQLIPKVNRFGSVNFVLDPLKMVEFTGQDYNRMLELNEFAVWALNNEAEIRKLLKCLHEGRQGCLWPAEMMYRSLNGKETPSEPVDLSDHNVYNDFRHRDIHSTEACFVCGRIHGKNMPCPEMTIT